MATTRRTISPTPQTPPADAAAALAAEMAGALTLFDVQAIGQNEARWTRLLELCEDEWRASAPDGPASLPPVAARDAVADRFDARLPKALEADAVKLDEWHGALLNIYADAGFRLGLAIGRGR
jgi:hypothetical protein